SGEPKANVGSVFSPIAMTVKIPLRFDSPPHSRPHPMARRSLFALTALVLIASSALAVITAPVELSAFIAEADHILLAKIEGFDADKNQFVLAVQEDLKGKLEFRKLPTVIRPDEDAVKGKHEAQLLKRLGNDVPIALFISREGKEMK